MTDSTEVRDFLMSRRARVNPTDVGLPSGSDRRVPGLRRSEVADLAGISVEYYTWMERGAIRTASDTVLDNLAAALRLDAAEKAHLLRLAADARGTAVTRGRTRPATPWKPSSSIQWLLDSMNTSAALIGNGRTDLLAWNTLGGALMHVMITTSPTATPNFARFLFLEPVARRFYPDWEAVAGVNVAQLRTEAGRDPHSRDLHELVGELSTRSDHFRRLWGRHDVWQHDTGLKKFDHPAIGPLALHFDGLDLVGQDAVQLTVLTAPPGTPDYENLQLLGSWTITDTAGPATHTRAVRQ